MEFRKDINALRAIAVIVVVVFHFSPETLKGGFVGVDVFFVISGFLMTGIVVGKLDKKSFSLIEFYKARFKRIVPALTVMLAAVTLYLWNFLFDIEFEHYLTHLYSSLLFYSNVLYWQEAGYFTAAAHENWLLHTWSLSVEWQFYALYPLLIALIYRLLGKKLLRRLILAGTLLSFGLGVFATNIWPDPAYFSLPTRAWQMLSGGLVFLYPLPPWLRKRWMQYLGLLSIFISAIFYSSSIGWPGYHSLLPIFGVCLVLLTGNEKMSFILNGSVIQSLGSWSYSIYLWHWPIVVYFYNQQYAVEWYHLFLGILLSVLCGFLSYTLVERVEFFRLKLLFFLSFVVFAGTATAFTVGQNSLRTISQDPRNIQLERYKKVQKNTQKRVSSSCRISEHIKSDGTFVLPKGCISELDVPTILIWGDSHAESLSTGLVLRATKHVKFTTIVSSGCQPSFNQAVGSASKLRMACDTANKLALHYVIRRQPEMTIIGMKDQHEKVDWQHNLTVLKENGVKKVLVIGPTPQFYPSLPLVYLRERAFGNSLSTRKLDKALIETDKKMKTIINAFPDVQYISLIDQFCKLGKKKSSCKVKVGDELIYFDYGHLNISSSLYLADIAIYPKIKQTLNILESQSH